MLLPMALSYLRRHYRSIDKGILWVQHHVSKSWRSAPQSLRRFVVTPMPAGRAVRTRLGWNALLDKGQSRGEDYQKKVMPKLALAIVAILLL